MINVNVTLLIQMFNFLLLLFLLNMVLFRPIRKIIRERNQIVDAFNADIASMTTSAQEAMTQFEEKVLEARREGMAKVQSMKADGLDVETKLIGDSTREAQDRTQAFREQVQAEIQGVRAQLRQQVEAFSVAMAEKILGRSVQ